MTSIAERTLEDVGQAAAAWRGSRNVETLHALVSVIRSARVLTAPGTERAKLHAASMPALEEAAAATCLAGAWDLLLEIMGFTTSSVIADSMTLVQAARELPGADAVAIDRFARLRDGMWWLSTGTGDDRLRLEACRREHELLLDALIAGPGFHGVLTDRSLPHRLAAEAAAGVNLVVYGVFEEITVVVVFVAGRSTPECAVLPVGTTTLRAWMDELWSALPAFDRSASARAAVQAISDAVAGCWLQAIDRSRPLWIVPHGVLDQFPFAALYDGELLGTQVAISSVPTAALVSPRSADLHLRGRRLAALGYPGDEGLADHLIGVRDELDVVATALGSRADAAWTTGAALGDRIRGCDVVHIACHARHDELRPLDSYLALAPGDSDDGRVSASTIARMKLDAHLVVLAACRATATSAANPLDNVGLALAFLRAGALVVLGALRPLSDTASVALMKELYPRLAAGAPFGESLRDAFRARLANGTGPHEWAHVGLVGRAPGTWRLAAGERRIATFRPGI